MEQSIEKLNEKAVEMADRIEMYMNELDAKKDIDLAKTRWGGMKQYNNQQRVQLDILRMQFRAKIDMDRLMESEIKPPKKKRA